jgi:indole-3-glycerol phosphate synthase
VVSESGIKGRADRDRLRALGVDALLVGEGLIASPDVAASTREVCGLPDVLVAMGEGSPG